MEHLNCIEEKNSKELTLKGKFENIDFNDWLLFSRNLNYELSTNGLDYCSYDLEVRWLKYKGKIYAFDLSFAEDPFNNSITLLVSDNKIISEYKLLFGYDERKKFLEKFLKLQLENMGCVCNDKARKLIIDFLNELIVQ